MVSTSPRVVTEHIVDFARHGPATSTGQVVQQHFRDLIGDVLGAEEAGERGQHDQEGKQRQHCRERDMARERPAVVLDERVDGVKRDAEVTLREASRSAPGTSDR